MEDKLYKARVLRGDRDEDMDLAWNIHNVEFFKESSTFIIHHAKGRVMHRLKEGDTIIMLEQFNNAEDNRG